MTKKKDPMAGFGKDLMAGLQKKGFVIEQTGNTYTVLGNQPPLKSAGRNLKPSKKSSSPFTKPPVVSYKFKVK